MITFEDAPAFSPLFAGLTPEQLETIRGRLHRTIFPQGTTIMAAEGPGESVFIVVTGTVKVHVVQEDGSDVIFDILGPGEVLGEMSAIDETPHSASVMALAETTCLWIEARAFRALLESMPNLERNLIRVLARRVRTLSVHVQTLSTKDIQGRIACQLLSFAREYGVTRDDGILIPIRLTQTDLADLVGSSRARVNHVLGSLKDRGAISVDGSYQITVREQSILERCAF